VYRGEENETDIWITEGAEPIMRPLEAVFDRFEPYFRFRPPFWSPLGDSRPCVGCCGLKLEPSNTQTH
jgi:hypothetical protein